MPSNTNTKNTISPGDKVLVTGCNGYVAVWLARRLLEKGYAVRGTVRSQSKTGYLKKLFESYGEKFEVVIVSDVTAEGAFDDCVKDVDAVAHTASPFPSGNVSVDELIEPAVKGTLGILKCAYNYGKRVKRIVILSSVASLMGSVDKLRTEEDWNDEAVEAVKKHKDDAPKETKYPASKTLAERAAWEYYEQVKEQVKWDIAVLNPPYVYGPVLHDVKGVDSLNTSMLEWYQVVVKGSLKSEEDLTGNPRSYIDVRDVADAHILALETPDAGGQRMIISAGSSVWQNWLDTAHSVDIPGNSSIPVGFPGKGSNPSKMFDAGKAGRVMGMKYRSMEETTRDVLEDIAQKKW